MLRLKLPGGSLTSAQLRQVAKIAAEKGREFADLTTAQEIQLYGIRPEDRPETMEQLEASGIRPQAPEESSRNLEGCPLAGVNLAEYFDSGVHEQNQPELFTIGVPVLAGRIDADQMKKAADLAERYADGTLRLTPRQNLMFLNVPKERVAQILEGLEAVHLSARASAAANALVLCPSGESASLLAKELVEHLEKRVPMDQPFTIHWSGSAGGCAHHGAAEIGLQGEKTFDVWINGRVMAGPIAADQLRFKIEQLLVGYKRNRGSGETFSDFCARVGDETVGRLLSEELAEKNAAD